MNDIRQKLRKLPSIDSILGRKDVAKLLSSEGRKLVTDAIRSLIYKKRQAIMKGGAGKQSVKTVITPSEIQRELEKLKSPSIVRVINATGVVIHTNLGRAPLPASSLDYLKELASGFSNLEYSIEKGRRGSRYDHIESLLSEMTGAEASHVVNNNAAAMFLATTALAGGREVIISRGELIEIGDGFRLPDVIQEGGARLVEVGTTNRTKLIDYEKAINEKTAMIVKAHQSNFYMEGFVEETGLEELVELGRKYSVPVLYDLGSGALELPETLGHTRGPDIRWAVDRGADIVACSGDKLLGGPQAGLLLGKKDIITFLRRHPLTRALRPCKLTITLLHHVLLLYRRQLGEEIPVYSMLAKTAETLKDESGKLAARLRRQLKNKGWSVDVIREKSRVGGGALPRAVLESWVIALSHGKMPAEKIEEKLRRGSVPIICRVKSDKVIIDLRTVSGEDKTVIVEALAGLKP